MTMDSQSIELEMISYTLVVDPKEFPVITVKFKVITRPVTTVLLGGDYQAIQKTIDSIVIREPRS